MSRCLGCFFHESGYMWNRCNLLETEYYAEPDDCTGFSINPVSKEEAKKLYERFVSTYNDSATDINVATKDGDVIYRGDVIYALDEIESEVAEGYGFQYEKWRKHFCELPSARPDHIADDSKKGETINRREAIELIERMKQYHQDADDIVEMISNMPSAQPERPRGRWIEYDNSHCECPFCHEEWSYFDNEVERFDFCPKCGADMRGE